jgi:hypothetical protein
MPCERLLLLHFVASDCGGSDRSDEAPLLIVLEDGSRVSRGVAPLGYGFLLGGRMETLSEPSEVSRLLRGRVVFGSVCSRIVDFNIAVGPNREFQIVARIWSRKVSDQGFGRIMHRTAFI